MDNNIPQSSTREQEIAHKIQQATAQLKQFRKSLHHYFSKRAATLMDLVGTLAGNTTARSPVELSLDTLFRREYCSIYDGIENLFVVSDPEKATEERRVQEKQLVHLIAGTLQPKQGKF